MIYLDNASTSFHKPDCVARAVVEAMHQAGNSGRGSSGEALEASRLIFDTRCQLAEIQQFLVYFIRREKTSMRLQQRWITTVYSAPSMLWKREV